MPSCFVSIHPDNKNLTSSIMRAINQDGTENFAGCIAMIVLTAVITISRFAVQFCYRKTTIGADWMCLLSVLLFYAYCAADLNSKSLKAIAARLDSRIRGASVENMA